MRADMTAHRGQTLAEDAHELHGPHTFERER